MNLYRVQDDDRPAYVVAESLGDAVIRWQAQIRRTNEPDEGEPYEYDDPEGVALIAAESHLDSFPELGLPAPESPR